MTSPLEISIALHYWTTPGDYSAEDPDHRLSPAVQSALHGFVEAGLLERRTEPTDRGSRFKATDGLRVWIEALCAVPLPVRIWIVPDRSERTK